MDNLSEALKPTVSVEFEQSALVEIERMASTYTSLGDKDQIEKKIIGFFLSRLSKTDTRKRLVVTRGDVITYEISQKLFDAGIFYFNSSTKNFVRITSDELGLASRDLRDPAYQDMINDEEEEEEEEEATDSEEEEEEEADLEDDDDSVPDTSVKQQEKSVAAEIGYTEAVALRQSGKALVRKTVTLTNGDRREVMMNPLARLYHLLPPQAIAGHVKELWSAHAMPLLERAEKRGMKGSALHSAVVGAITNFFDQLRLDTCLTDSEINSIQSQFPNIVDRASGDQKTPAVKLIESGVHAVIDNVVAGKASNRAKGSNLFNYLTQRTMRPEDEMAILTGDMPSKRKVVTPAQQVEIDTSGAVTSKLVSKIAQKIELMMSVENAEMPKNEKFIAYLRQKADADTSSVLDNVHLATSAEVAGALEGIGVKEKGVALSGEDATSWMVNAIDASRGIKSEELAPTVNLSLTRGPKGDVRQFKPVTATVRSGETIGTLHNSLRDLSAIPPEFENQRRQIPTAASVLLEHIKDVLEKIKSQLFNLKSERQDPRFVTLCTSLRDNVERLSGLLEYYAMSGMDILPDDSRELTTRKKILNISAQTHEIALKITDAVVDARSAMRRKRADRAIEADIAVFDSQLKLAEREENETLRKSKQKEAQDAIRLLQKEKELRSSRAINSTLEEAVGAAFKGSPLEEAESALDAFKQVDLEARINNQCSIYQPTASRDERGTPSQRESSDFTLELVNTRLERIKRAQRDRLGRVTAQLASANNSQTIAASRALSAEAQYEQSVRDTTKSLLAHNKYQMHLLQRGDTIRTILQEYEVAAVPTASDLTLGFTFSATLPRQYDRSSQLVHRVYTIVGELPEKKRNEVQVILQYTDSLTGSEETIIVPRSVISKSLKEMMESGSKAEQLNNQALARFANALRFSKIAALSQLGRKGLAGKTALPSLDEPILEYFGRFLFEYDRDRCTSIINQTGIETIKDSMESAGFSEDALPTVNADIPITDGTKRALCALADLARRFDMGPQFIRAAKGAIEGKDPVSAQRSAFDAVSQIARTGPVRFRSILSQRAADDVDDFLESLPEEDDQRDRAEVLLSSVLEVMTQIETARNELDKAQENRESGFYEDMLVNIPIPVPGRRLLMPGSRLTVVPPRRTLSETSREVIRLFGITPESLVSRPTRGMISAVKIASHKAALFPILDTLAVNLGDALYEHFIDILNQTGDRNARRAQRLPGAGKALCANYIKKILYDALDPEKTYDSMSSHLTEAAHHVLGPLMRDVIIKGVNIQSINHSLEVQLVDSVRVLSIAAESASADALLTTSGVRSLYTVAPCTATFLNASAFSSRERLLLDIVSPPPDEALTLMTPGLYNQILGGGIQKSKESKPGDAFVFSRGSDSLGVRIKVLNDCYMSLKKAIEAASENKKPMVVIHRMLKKAAKTPRPLETVARQFGISQVKSESDPRLISAVKEALEQISEEMSLISDGSESSRLTAEVLDIVYRAAGPNKEEIQQQLDVEKEAVNCLSNMVNLIKTIDVTQVSSASAMITHAPREVLDIASRQLMTQIVNSLTQQMRASYGAKSREAKAQYMSVTRRS